MADFILPSIFARPDPEIDLDICANVAVDHQIRYMLKNSFGFGGINCCTLIGRYEARA